LKKVDEKIIRFIKENNLFEQGTKILVALSGGPDSVFLLYFLLKYRKKYKLTIAAMHVNHMIRAKEADRDEKFCKKLCSELNVEFHSSKKDVPAYSKKNKISIEEAARDLRYKELLRVQKKFGFDKIATAHTCSDNAETIFLNLIKGTGIKGLSGIPIQRNNIIRPILSVTKDEILSYLKANKIKYMIDQSNLSNEYERNLIRNELFPLIKKHLNPKLEQTLFKSSSILKKHSAVLNYAIGILSNQVTKMKKSKLEIDINKLLEVDESVWSDVIKSSVEANFKVHISFNDCLKIISLISNKKSKIVNLSSGLMALREEKTILIFVRKAEKKVEMIGIKIGDINKVDNKILSLQFVDKQSIKFSDNRNTEYIDADKVMGEFWARPWKTGDKFYPFGMNGSQKISDFLNHQKVSSSMKKEQLVLVNDDKIVWVVGYRVDNRFKITNKTRKVLQLCLT